MSDNKKKLKLCTLTSFYSPYLFWLVLHDDIPSRKKLQEELNNPKTSYHGLGKPENGEYVLAIFEDDWVRAELMGINKIKENYCTDTTYTCFLMDYGIIITTYKVFKLPGAYHPKRLPPIALNGVLYGLTPNVTLHERRQTEWLPGIRVVVETIVSNKILQTFYIENRYDNVVIGDVILEGNGEKISLSKELATKNFASFDPEYDVTQISERPLREVYFLFINLVGLKPKRPDDEHSVTSSRSLEAITKDMLKPGVKVRDDYFADIDNVLSNKPVRNPITQSKAFDVARKLKKAERVSSIEDDHKKFENVEKLKQTVLQNYRKIESSLAGLNLEELGSLNEPLGRGRPRSRYDMTRSKSVGRNFGSMRDYQDSDSESERNRTKNYNYKKFLGRGRCTADVDNFQHTFGRGFSNSKTMPSGLKSILKKDKHSEPNNDDFVTSSRGRDKYFDDADDHQIKPSGKDLLVPRRTSAFDKFLASGRGFRKPSEFVKEKDLTKPGSRTTPSDDDNVTKQPGKDFKIPRRISAYEKFIASGRGFRKTTPEPDNEKDLPKSCGRGEVGFSPEGIKPTGKPSSYVRRDKPGDFEDAEHFGMISKISGKKNVVPTHMECKKTSETDSDKELASKPADFDMEDTQIKSSTRRLLSKISAKKNIESTNRELKKRPESESDKELSSKSSDLSTEHNKMKSSTQRLISKISTKKNTESTDREIRKTPDSESDRELYSKSAAFGTDHNEMKSSARQLISKISTKKNTESTDRKIRKTPDSESDRELSSKSVDFDTDHNKMKSSTRQLICKLSTKTNTESTDREIRKTPDSESDRELSSKSTDFDMEDTEIKSSARRLISKLSSKKNSALTNREFRKSTESESDKDLSPKTTNFVKKDLEIKSSGRGLLLSKIKLAISESESEKDPKSFGKHIAKLLATAKKSDDSDSSVSRSIYSSKSKSSDDQYQDAQETSDSRKSLFRDSPVEEVDGLAAGSNFGCPRKIQQGFRGGRNQKRPPNIDFGSCLSDYDTQQDKGKWGKRKRIAGFCQCSTCEGWRNKDCVFKDPEQEIEKREPLKNTERPCLLFKSADEVINVPFQNNRHFANETQKLSAPRILVHSCVSVNATYDLPLIAFHGDVQRAMRSLQYTNAHSIQVYTWSAILRGESAIIVSGSDCGKTMVYVPALCSFLYNQHPEISKKSGPQSIILCPTVCVVEDVSRLFNSILKRIDKDHSLISVPYYNNHISQRLLKHSFDIVVTTPRILIKLYKDDAISLQKLCHIVLEEAHDLFTLFPKEIYYIMGKVNNVLQNRTCLVQIQVITVTQEWNMKIENFAKKFKFPPLVCIGAHLETALYGRANIKIQLSNENEKPEKVINLIKDVYKDSKTLILCNDIQIPRNLISMLDNSEIMYETLLLNSAVEEINNIKRKWMTAADNYFVLVCSDNIFNTGLAITDAEIIVQYSLPENWSQFTFRFSGFLDNYSSPINTSAENMKKSVMHIMMDNVNIKPYPKLLHFLQRMNTKITDVMVSIYENLQDESENEKLNNDITLCEKFLCFDACKNFISCKYRHILNPKTDVSPTIPMSGLIKFKVLHVESPIKYSCRLIEHTDSDNNVHEICDAFGLIATQLLAVKDKLNMVASNKIKVGMIFAVQEVQGIAKGNFQRARILEDVVVAGFNKKVLVRFIDLGFDQQVQTTQLYYLPNHILEHPPQSVTVYIADVAPLDYDTTWAYKLMSSFKREFRKCGYNCYFTGRIKLQLGECLFVDDLKLQELIEDYSIVIHKMSVCETLKNMQAIEIIPRLQKLYKLCEKYNIPLENYNLPEIKVESKIKPQVKPSWAHLENLQEFNQVYFVSAVDPSSFIVRLSKNLPLLEQLHTDIKKAMDKPHFPNITEVKENYCYALYDAVEDIFARVKISKIKSDMVDCFFVDYGDRKEVNKKELKFLPDEFITKLPFQAIECSLYGVEPTDDIWLDEATDIFYNIATEPNSDILRYLYVKIMDKEPAQFTGYKKYSVILIDILKYDTIINNVFTEQGLAIPLTNEPIEIDFDKLKESIAQKIISDDDENIEKENVEEENIEEIVRSDDLDFDDKWDLVINNPEEFFAGLNIPVQKMNQIEGTSEQISENKSKYVTNMKALPPVDFSTPDIVWQQTKSHITLRIQIPNVENYEADIEESQVFKFRTDCGGRIYKVHLTLFNQIEDLEHSNMGLYILAKMKKITEENWPRLIDSEKKMRYIKYNVLCIPIDEESDDERPITAKMIQSSKILGTEFNKIAEDETAPCIFEYGSDIDWEESDVESDRDSDES